MQNLDYNQRLVGPEYFQGYLSREINIFTINGNYNIYPLHVDSQNLYCTENGTMLPMIVPLGHITSIQCV
ncbi:hypothetical protein J2N67_006407 (plasmid) [Bacillus thuringiensis]|uniref:Uncharacterized protein n=1 Tax=Bacillus thuringiensis HD-771 TaxID=1218175 RepID=A0A9W3JGY9_BACTU|nr:hypothetical protein BTG_33033 [Bacillus thuringiensis HD-771]USP56158.1 hypothetical protein J2N67_006407 [Bacillus thuringiensis]